MGEDKQDKKAEVQQINERLRQEKMHYRYERKQLKREKKAVRRGEPVRVDNEDPEEAAERKELEKRRKREEREERKKRVRLSRSARREEFEKAYLRKKVDNDGNEYDISGEVHWDKLDNSAHLFPAIAGQGMSNVYRIAVYLDEDIVREKLAEALETVLPKFSVFNCRMRQGMFWYYFEENGKEPPTVEEENTYPCLHIEENQNRNYLFRVTYYGRRINLEAFHVLTDGTGALCFLKELTYQYLRLVHPELRERYGDRLSGETSLNTEDSFLKNYDKGGFGKGYKSYRAFILKGKTFPTRKMGIMHGHMPVEEVRCAAKRYSATINEYMVSALIWSVYRAYFKEMSPGRPITAAVPVNLRPWFGSVTSKNFFVMVTAAFDPGRKKDGGKTFDDVVESVRTSLAEQMTKEHLESVLAYNVAGEQTMILRAIPLVFKNPGLRGIYNMHAKANSTTVTNLGNITVAQEYREYIKRFDVMLSRSKGQNLKMALSSYEGTLSATITSVMRDVELQRAFFTFLVEQGISVTLETNGVYYQ